MSDPRCVRSGSRPTSTDRPYSAEAALTPTLAL